MEEYEAPPAPPEDWEGDWEAGVAEQAGAPDSLPPLPAEVWAQVLRHVTVQERLMAACVAKALKAASALPAAWQEATLVVPVGSTRAWVQCIACCARYGRHVRQLTLSVPVEDWERTGGAAQDPLPALRLVSVLPHFAAARCLRVLAWEHLDLEGVAAAMPGLEALVLVRSRVLHMEHLGVLLGRLPGIALLSSLQRLEIGFYDYPCHEPELVVGLQPHLAQLTALTWLHVHGKHGSFLCERLPAAAPQLPAKAARLSVRTSDARAWQDVLPVLCQLGDQCEVVDFEGSLPLGEPMVGPDDVSALLHSATRISGHLFPSAATAPWPPMALEQLVTLRCPICSYLFRGLTLTPQSRLAHVELSLAFPLELARDLSPLSVLTGLTHLAYQTEGLRNLPVTLPACLHVGRLRHVELSGAMLTRVPPLLEGATQLVSLSLAENQGLQLGDECVALVRGLAALRTLTLTKHPERGGTLPLPYWSPASLQAHVQLARACPALDIVFR